MAKQKWTYDQVDALYRSAFPNMVDGAGRSILLAMGDGSGRNACATVLRRHDFAVDALPDGLEALRYLCANSPHCCVMDLQLSHVDGIELLQAIRSDPLYAHIPVVVIYGAREEQDAQVAQILGATVLVQMPLQYDTFVKLVLDACVKSESANAGL